VQMLVKHFEKAGDLWRLNERTRSMVRYQRHNLLEDPRTLGRFDIVFCRNVLIYFDAPTKAEVFERIAQTMNPGGFLLLGAAESVIGITQAFETAQDRRGLYKLVNRAAKVA